MTNIEHEEEVILVTEFIGKLSNPKKQRIRLVEVYTLEELYIGTSQYIPVQYLYCEVKTIDTATDTIILNIIYE